jgi:transposase
MQIEDHYGLLLGIHLPWLVSDVDLSIEHSKVDIVVEYPDDTGICPECKSLCKRYDYRESRTWRHLDTMQFTTYIHCAVPRIQCDKHGIKTVDVPWAGKHSRFTLLFETFAIRVLQAARSIEEAKKLLNKLASSE